MKGRASALVASGVSAWLLLACSSQAELSTFRATLPDMIEDFGEDARVVSFRVESSDSVVWEVLTSDGTVHRRSYREDNSPITDSQSNPTSSERVEGASERQATSEDLEEKGIALGQLDPGIYDELLAEADADPLTTDGFLKGETWTIDPVGTPFENYTASYDGTDLRKVRTGP